MKKTILRLFLMFVLAWPAVAQNRLVSHTASSGIDIDSIGRFSIGIEGFFFETSPQTAANSVVFSRSFRHEIPTSECMIVNTGSLGFRPPYGWEYGGKYRVGVADALFRIRFGPTENVEESFIVGSWILKATLDPVNIPIGQFQIPVATADRYLFVTIEQAGASFPHNVEIHATGYFGPCK